MGKIIQYPAWIIPFPVLKINFEVIDTNVNCLVKDFSYQRPGNGRNNKISCLDNTISCFENHFQLLFLSEVWKFR